MDKLDQVKGLLRLINSSEWEVCFIPFLEDIRDADRAKLEDVDDDKARGRIQLAKDLLGLRTYLEKEKQKLEAKANA